MFSAGLFHVIAAYLSRLSCRCLTDGPLLNRDDGLTTLRDRTCKWLQQMFHVRYLKSLWEDAVDKAISWNYLTEGLFYPEIEGFVSAI